MPAALVMLAVLALIAVACDGDAAPTPPPGSTPSAPAAPPTATLPLASPTPSATPTPARPFPKGAAVSALTALRYLREAALEWRPDARLVMLANARAGAEGRLLSVALSDPALTEPAPTGLGKRWTLVASSPAGGVAAFSVDDLMVDLVAEGKVSSELAARLSSPDLAGSDLSKLDLEGLRDSDLVWARADGVEEESSASIALVMPAALGLEFPVEEQPDLAYELFSTDPARGLLWVFSATTGDLLYSTKAR